MIKKLKVRLSPKFKWKMQNCSQINRHNLTWHQMEVLKFQHLFLTVKETNQSNKAMLLFSR